MKILCPICKQELTLHERSFSCDAGHNFDLAKEGYLNLNLKSSVHSGDEKPMVIARRQFLNHDYYLFLREKLNELIREYSTRTLLDLGCGEGYYTAAFDAQEKVGIDLSKETLRLASKTDKTTFYILSSIFHVPLEDESIDTVITCFAPVAVEEIGRLLKDKGHFILVRPDKRHLYELKEAVYDHPYENEAQPVDVPPLKRIREEKISHSVTLKKEEVKELFTMTPYYHKTSFKDKEKLDSISELSITFSFLIDVFEK